MRLIAHDSDLGSLAPAPECFYSFHSEMRQDAWWRLAALHNCTMSIKQPQPQPVRGLASQARLQCSIVQVVNGEVCLEDLEDASLTDEEVLKKLKALPGMGPFSAANMLQLLGRYSRIACDSETVRHIRAHHGVICNTANVQEKAQQVMPCWGSGVGEVGGGGGGGGGGCHCKDVV